MFPQGDYKFKPATSDSLYYYILFENGRWITIADIATVKEAQLAFPNDNVRDVIPCIPACRIPLNYSR